jgi:hypothetical protein
MLSKAARGTVGTAYAFQEHMKEETEIVFKLKLYLIQNLRVKLEELAMEHRNRNVFIVMSPKVSLNKKIQVLPIILVDFT